MRPRSSTSRGPAGRRSLLLGRGGVPGANQLRPSPERPAPPPVAHGLAPPAAYVALAALLRGVGGMVELTARPGCPRSPVATGRVRPASAAGPSSSAASGTRRWRTSRPWRPSPCSCGARPGSEIASARRGAGRRGHGGGRGAAARVPSSTAAGPALRPSAGPSGQRRNRGASPGDRPRPALRLPLDHGGLADLGGEHRRAGRLQRGIGLRAADGPQYPGTRARWRSGGSLAEAVGSPPLRRARPWPWSMPRPTATTGR